MKRTTLVLAEDVARRLKQKAADTGQTMKALINSLLHTALYTAAHPKKHFQLKWKTHRGILLPGVKLDDRDALFDLMDEK